MHSIKEDKDDQRFLLILVTGLFICLWVWYQNKTSHMHIKTNFLTKNHAPIQKSIIDIRLMDVVTNIVSFRDRKRQLFSLSW